MKTVRSLLVAISVFVILLGLAVTGVKAQSLRTTDFAGKFTLPFMVEWGPMTLPPGEYNLYYGNLNLSGPRMVEVSSEELGFQRGLILPRGQNELKATKSALVCVIECNRG